MSDALAKKIHDQTATPGSEAAVREWFEAIAAGTPDYDRFGASVAETVRQQLPELQPWYQRLGAIKSVDFKGVGPGGADIYEVTFENGALEVRVRVAPGPNSKLWQVLTRSLR